MRRSRGDREGLFSLLPFASCDVGRESLNPVRSRESMAPMLRVGLWRSGEVDVEVVEEEEESVAAAVPPSEKVGDDRTAFILTGVV